MQSLIPEINKTAQLVQEIAAASIEQNSGADQVNSAIQQLNQVTQQNAAASEEMATSSEELASQADQLLEMVSYFRLDQQRARKKSNFAAKKAPNKPAQNFAQNMQTQKPGHAATEKTAGSKDRSGGINIDLGKVKDEEYEKF